MHQGKRPMKVAKIYLCGDPAAGKKDILQTSWWMLNSNIFIGRCHYDSEKGSKISKILQPST